MASLPRKNSRGKRPRTETGSSSQPPTQSYAPPVWPRDENTPFEVELLTKDPLKKVLTGKNVDEREISGNWDDYDSLLYNEWLKVAITPTRFAHPRSMTRLHIKEEVIALLAKVGLKKFVSREQDLYPDLVRQFFASVKLYNTAETTEQKQDPSRFFLSFMANGVRYAISARAICKVFGFPESPAGDLPIDIAGGVQTLWSHIGAGRYDVAKSTHSDLRHPVIRYLVRVFSTTILCKLEPGKMRKHELVLLSYALRDLVPNATWDSFHPNMGMVFMDHLYSLRHTPIKTSTVSNKRFTAGSMLTPIFVSCGVNMSGYDITRTSAFVDLEHMASANWVKNEVHWIFSIALGQQRMVELPLVPHLMEVSKDPALLLFAPEETLTRLVEPTRKLTTRGNAGASTSQASASQAAPPQYQHRFPSPPRGQMTEHERWVTRALKATWDAISCVSRGGCVRPRTPSPPRQPPAVATPEDASEFLSADED